MKQQSLYSQETGVVRGSLPERLKVAYKPFVIRSQPRALVMLITLCYARSASTFSHEWANTFSVFAQKHPAPPQALTVTINFKPCPQPSPARAAVPGPVLADTWESHSSQKLFLLIGTWIR